MRRSDQVVLIIITSLYGTQQSVLGRDTPRLDSPKCMILCCDPMQVTEGNE